MRKSFITGFTLLSFLTLPTYSKMIVEKEEYTASSMVKDFALENFYQRFHNVTKEYNQNRSNLENFSSSFKELKEKHKFYAWLKKNGVTTLPEAKINEGLATIQVGKHQVQYSILTLARNEILINEKALKLESLNFKQALDKIKDKVLSQRRYSLLDVFIPNAYADGMSALENTLLATLLYLNADFAERDWCLSCADEDKEVTKKNFEKLLEQIDEKLVSCENESDAIEEVYSNLSFFEGRDDEGGFRSSSAAQLKNFFPQIEQELKDVSCESLVFNIYKDEILPKAKHVLTQYAEGDSYRNLMRATATKEKYENKVKSSCNRVAQLNACMINNSYTAKDVYNNSRSHGEKELNWRSRPSREYKIRGLRAISQ